MTAGEFHADDLAAFAADDALLDVIAAGVVVPVQRAADGTVVAPDDMVVLLRDWRTELEDAASDRDSVATPPNAPAGSRWTRLHRHTAGAAAVVAVLAASTGVAAAASGPTGPLAGLHRALFGAAQQPSPERADTIAPRVTAILDDVAAGLRGAHSVGGVTAAQRADLGDRLDSAGRLLAADDAAPASLSARLDRLRADLAALETLPTAPPDVTTGVPDRAPAQPDGQAAGDADQSTGTSHDGAPSAGSGDGDQPSSDGSEPSDGGGTDGDPSSSDGTATTSDGGSDGDSSTSSDSGSSDAGSTSSDSGATDSGSSDSGSSDSGSSDSGSSDGTDVG